MAKAADRFKAEEIMIRWYKWGDEKTGFISIWILTPEGRVKTLGTLKKEDLPEGSKYQCPYN